MLGGAIGDDDSDHGSAAAAPIIRAVLSALNEHARRPHLPVDPVPAASPIRLALDLVVVRFHPRGNGETSRDTNSRVLGRRERFSKA